MPHRILEPVVVAPLVAVVSTLATSDMPDPSAGWMNMLIGPLSGLAISLVVLYFLKGYYDRSIARDTESRKDLLDLLERVVTLSTRQHEQQAATNRVIEENTKQTMATNAALENISKTLKNCHEK